MAGKITIKQAAELLGVNSSTIRNWIKLGKITRATHDGKKWQIAADEIASLKQAIESGELPYLRSRRNKRAVTGNFVPDNYLDDKNLVQSAQTLMHLASRLSGQGQILLLLELYLILLKNKDLVAVQDTGYGQALVSLWLNGDLELGPYSQLAVEFWELCSASTPEDYHRLGEMHKLRLKVDSSQDFLGLVYMSVSSLRKRKNAGSYYTPTSIVQKLIDASFEYLNPATVTKVVDPCCGSGNFLIHLALFLRDCLLMAGCGEHEADQKIVDTLAGCDNDPIAVLLTKMNLSLLLKSTELIPQLQIVHGDTLHEFSGQRFDLIIGNPPWGYQFSQREVRRLARRYQTAQSNCMIESFNLFVEWAVNHVNGSGLISYVLPEAFLTAQLHTLARKLVLQSCQIEEVARLGMVFSQVTAPVITLVARKNGHPAKLLPSNASLGFYAYGSQMDQAILSHIQALPNVVYLKDNADFALGIVTGNNRKYLLSDPVPGSEPVISGRDVLPYRIKKCIHYLVYNREQFQQVAPDHLYRAPEKLVYRFIHKNLIVAYDRQGRLSINSANIIIPRIEGVSIKYVLAVLNSRIAQYFRMVTNPSVKVLRSLLETIPIVVCTPAEENTIVDLVDRIIGSKNPAQCRNLYDEIDQKLMNYYKLPERYQTYIRRKSQTFESLCSHI